jgi:transposase InsO family protein
MTGAEIAETLAMPLKTVQGLLTKLGLGKRSRLDQEQLVRYERSRPGELVHLDVTKLGRIERGAGKRIFGGSSHYNRTFTDREGRRRNTVGWEFCHIAIDDYSRLAYVELLGDEKATTAVGFLRRALAHYRSHGIRVERVMTDNGSAYRSTAHAIACRTLGIKHLRTRPRRPQTNGKNRALHPHPARRLGLRAHLRLKRRAQGRARPLARVLQSPPTTPRPRPQAAHHPLSGEQPPRVLQLARRVLATTTPAALAID